MKKDKLNIIIVGAGVAGHELLTEFQKHFPNYYQVSGFVDDDPKKIGQVIDGVNVLGRIENLDKLISKLHINEVYISIPSAQGETIRRIIEKCQKEKVIFRIVPRLLEIIQGKVKLNQIRQINIEDLLGRAIVKSEQSIFEEEFKNKRVLVTGAAGSIGSEICRQIIQFKPEKLYGFDWWENGIFELEQELGKISSRFQGVIGNIQDYKEVKGIIHSLKPDVIFHAAAFKHVPLMQRFPAEAVKNNVFGTENVASIAYEEGVKKFVFISTDKAANPVSVMGTTKMIGENIVQRLNTKDGTKYIAVRFGNVLGSHGSVVPIFSKQIAEGGPVTVTDPDMIRFFMTITEAVQLVLHASVLGKGGEIFILDMGEPVKIYDLAKLMISLAGFVPEEEIKIEFTGKRLGEKLVEVLKSEKEVINKTTNEKIFVVKAKEEVDLADIIQGLKKVVVSHNDEKIYDILEKIAPNIQRANV